MGKYCYTKGKKKKRHHSKKQHNQGGHGVFINLVTENKNNMLIEIIEEVSIQATCQKQRPVKELQNVKQPNKKENSYKELRMGLYKQMK